MKSLREEKNRVCILQWKDEELQRGKSPDAWGRNTYCGYRKMGKGLLTKLELSTTKKDA